MPQPESQKVFLDVSLRSATGKGAAALLRRQECVPGIVYGEGKPSVAVVLKNRDLTRALKTKAGENVLITLRLKEDSKKPTEMAVLIRELQHHPVTHRIIHVDFHQVSLTKRITVAVPVSLKGEAVGVTAGGGILEHLKWEITVECLPTQIPSEIPLDVSALELGKTLYAKDVPLPEGVRLVTAADLPVAACVTPKEEEVAAAPAAEAGAEPAEPEVLKQKKPEEIAAEEEQKAKEKEAASADKGKGKS